MHDSAVIHRRASQQPAGEGIEWFCSRVSECSVSLVAADDTPKHGSPSAPDSCVLVWAARRHGERNYNFPQLMRLTGTPADVERGAQLVYDLLGQHKDLAHNVVEVSGSSCQSTCP